MREDTSIGVSDGEELEDTSIGSIDEEGLGNTSIGVNDCWKVNVKDNNGDRAEVVWGVGTAGGANVKSLFGRYIVIIGDSSIGTGSASIGDSSSGTGSASIGESSSGTGKDARVDRIGARVAKAASSTE